MPCYDERTSGTYVAKQYEGRVRELEAALNQATRAACELFRLMPGFGDAAWDEISPGTIKWCKEHKKMDARRKKSR